MDNIKIVVSHNYIPCKEALDYYAGKKQFIHIFASSSVQREDLSKLPSSISFKLDIDCPKSRPDLNWTLCELTNLYAGASLPDVIDAEYIGLCHYRRLFNISQLESCIEINKPDIICAQPAGTGQIGQMFGIKGQYEAAHSKEDFDMLEGYIKESFLHQQKPEVLDIWERKIPYLVAPCNCIVMKRPLFLDYCNRIFRVLLDICQKKSEEFQKRDNYQRRAAGFLGERLTSWYVAAQSAYGKSVMQLPLEFHQDWKPATATDGRKMQN